MPDESMTRLHAIVEGTVQGVGFRMFVVDIASRLGLTGWVRNRWDDTVEVIAEGESTALDTLVKALNRGPHMAGVSKVTTEWGSATGEFRQFWIRQTY